MIPSGPLQIVCVLYRFLIRILHQSSIASERIRNDFLLFFHTSTSRDSFPWSREKRIAFFRP